MPEVRPRVHCLEAVAESAVGVEEDTGALLDALLGLAEYVHPDSLVRLDCGCRQKEGEMKFHHFTYKRKTNKEQTQ